MPHLHQGSRRRLGSVQGQLDAQAEALAWDLQGVIQGEVRFDAGSRALYATDGSNYRQVPVGVVVPRNVEDVIATINACRAHGVPLLSRGGGTSLAGQCCNAAVVMDWSKYLHHLLELNPAERYAWVEPGLVLDDLRRAANQHDLTFAPDPATHTHCTLGGMMGNNSCGVHSVMGGRTADNVLELEVLTYRGSRFTVGQTSEAQYQQIQAEGGERAEIYRRLRGLIDRVGDEVRRRFPRIPRRVSGYNLDELLPENHFDVAKALVGTESTCVTILRAKLRLVPWPKARSLLVLGYPDVFQAADHVMEVLAAHPIGLEGIDQGLIDKNRKKGMNTDKLTLLPPGGGYLLVEFGGATKEEADAQAHALMDRLHREPHAPTMSLFDDPEQEEMVWKIRESSLGATANVPGEHLTWPGWEDAAVHPEQLGGYLREFRDLLKNFGYDAVLYGHFGQACVHTRIPFELRTQAGIAQYRRFVTEAAKLVVRYHGSLSGEHGDGQSRAELLPLMFGNQLVDAFREFKAIWDPDGKMNPGKVVDPYRIDQNLRLGTDYAPWTPKTFFSFSADHHDFSRAALRCVGVGDCRREDHKTMCPSYRETREEMHSTRGRARLLFEMLNGQELTKGWREPAVKEALDLCLACKGCKGDCPVNVDMATYKSEFLAHYYARRLRPRTAYAFGWIWWWMRAASRVPSLVNAVTHAPGLAPIAKWLAGMPQERTVPWLAPVTFRAWFQRRTPRAREGRPPVLLWVDTFNDFFHPHTARAAVEVLEAAGYHVLIPPRPMCCGRPLYDYGFLNMARRRLEDILDGLRPLIREGVPLVGLEPSCLAVFKDELPNLLPTDEDGRRLRHQSYSLAGFLDHAHWTPPRLERDAIFHAHCHQAAVLGVEPDRQLLGRMGLRWQQVDSGCCGMAGSFGFEKEHYPLSVAVGERVLLPTARQAPPQTVLIADGFSCRTQVEQLTQRLPLHLAEVLALALTHGPQGPAVERCEDAVPAHDWLPEEAS